MHIVLATPLYPPEIGGPATYTKEIAQRLRGEHTITIVALADSPEAIPGVELVAISKKLPAFLRVPLFFFALVRRARTADVIYVQNAVAAGLPAVFAGAFLHKPVVLKFVGDEAWERATQAGLTSDLLDAFLAKPMPSVQISVLHAIQTFVLRRVSLVVPPSAFLGSILTKRYGLEESRVKVNYNAFEPTAEAGTVARVPRRIVSIGRLVKWKHVEGIIDALKLVRLTYPDVSLMVIGDGPERGALEAHAKEAGVEQSVSFMGRCSHEEASALLKSGELQVLNSTYEGLPHVALESFAARVPIVATNIGGTNEAVVHERSGLLVAPGDVRGLSQAVMRMFGDSALENALCEGGKDILTQRFSWDAHLATLLAVFKEQAEN